MPAVIAIPLIILGMILILVTLPISLPLGLLIHWRHLKRLNAAVDSTCCERCGTDLGEAALVAANVMHMDKLGALQRLYPTSRVNVVRRADACCIKCGKAYAWDARSAGLLPVMDDG